MKTRIKILNTVVALFIATSVMAQAPQKMSYQAVIRNSSNNLVVSTPVGMRISILQGSAFGAPVYVETQNPTSNANGLVSLEIGTGTVVSGLFMYINWANGPYFIKTETDPLGGIAYTITGTSELSSVPYALHAGNSWNLTGNSGEYFNFLGTIDSIPLNFKMNSQVAGTVNGDVTYFGYLAGNDTIYTTSGNTGFGTRALYGNNGYFNTSVGYNSLSSNQIGGYNTAVGYEALRNNTNAYANTAYGFGALNSTTTGGNNTAVGAYSQGNNQTGTGNTSLGSSTLTLNTGSNNTAVGVGALYHNTSGFENTALGVGTLYKVTYAAGNIGVGNYANTTTTTGWDNIGIGYQSLGNGIDTAYSSGNQVGSSNIAIGTFAGYSLGSNSNNNTFLGFGANILTTGTNTNNSMALGSGAVVQTDNMIRLGNGAISNLECNVGLTVTSDARFKYNVQENVKGLDFINKLRPVTYYFDNEKFDRYTLKDRVDSMLVKNPTLQLAYDASKTTVRTGFIAQEVDAAAKETEYPFSGVSKPQTAEGYYGLRYDEFVVPLTKAVQELSIMVEDLKKQNDLLLDKIKKLEDAQK